MKAIKHHPTEALIKQFSEGLLSPALSLGVSAHIDMCPHCQRVIDVVEAELSQQWQIDDTIPASAIPTIEDSEFAAMFSQIVDSPEGIEISQNPPEPATATLTLGEREFVLPRALQRMANKSGRWQHLGKLWRAPLALSDEFKASFIYIEGDGQIPEHTHQGTEWTLVLNGSFSDEQGHYQAGDFVRLDGSHKHAPKTSVGEDCLCFAVVEAPLHFTSGISRLLNPFAKFMQ
jgi:putative transcriptional regulator